MRNYWTIWTLTGVALLLPLTPVLAQPAPPAGAGGLNFSATKQEITANGLKLTGNAHINSPQLDVVAQTITFNYKNNQITEVRAIGSVRLKVNLASQNNQPARIESASSQAVLIPTTRVLTLTGSVNGFYQVGTGPKNTLKGDKAVLSYVNKTINADITGAQGVTVVVPANGLPQAGSLQVGDVTITAQRAVVEEGKAARFIGKAHAVSAGGPNGFDVTAEEFTLNRAADGTMQDITTTGRTHISLDLPPEPPAANATPVTVTANGEAAPTTTGTLPGGNAAKGNGGILGNVGRPTHVEAYADVATLTFANLTLTLNGNVTGSYQLAPAGGTPSTYNFSGAKAVLRSVPADKTTGGTLAGFNAILPALIPSPRRFRGHRSILAWIKPQRVVNDKNNEQCVGRWHAGSDYGAWPQEKVWPALGCAGLWTWTCGAAKSWACWGPTARVKPHRST